MNATCNEWMNTTQKNPRTTSNTHSFIHSSFQFQPSAHHFLARNLRWNYIYILTPNMCCAAKVDCPRGLTGMAENRGVK